MIFKIPIKIKKIRENAIIPKYAHNTDSGADLYIANIKARKNKLEDFNDVHSKSYTLKPFETVLCQTGFILEPPAGMDIEIRPTSGNSLKTPLRIPNAPATIDNGFRGEIGIIIQNVSLENWTISEGDKIAQMLVHMVTRAKFEEVEDLSYTERGTKGYGSTGIAGGNNEEKDSYSDNNTSINNAIRL